MKIYFGMRSTRDIIMRHGVLTAGRLGRLIGWVSRLPGPIFPLISMLTAVLPTSQVFSF